MRSTFLTWCLVVVGVLTARPGWAQVATQYYEYVDTGATGNYNLAGNWNKLLYDSVAGTYYLASPQQSGVPANKSSGGGTMAVAYIRNSATVTMVNSVSPITALKIGQAGDLTEDTAGTIQPRPGSTLELKPGADITIVAPAGGINRAPHNCTVGASYDGTLNIKGGAITVYDDFILGGAGTTNRNISLSPSGLVPYQGTGYMNISSGNFSLAFGTCGLYIGDGRTIDPSGNRATGIAKYMGGNVSMTDMAMTNVGYWGGKGSLVVSELDPIHNRMIVDSPNGVLSVGWFGAYGYQGGTYGWSQRSEGTYIQNGGKVTMRGLMVGRGYADGLFVLNGGSFLMQAQGESHIGEGGGRADPLGGTVHPGYNATGNGTLIVNGGYFEWNSTGKFIVGRGASDDGSAYQGRGVGVFTINGGVVNFYRQGSLNSLEVGNGASDPSHGYYGSYGEFNVLGGTFSSSNNRILFAKNEGCTGVFHPGKDAYVEVGWLALYENSSVNSTVKMIVDVTNTGNSMVQITEASPGSAGTVLKGTLDTETYGWRPHENDKFQIMKVNTYTGLFEGDFSTFTSNITNGLPLDPNGQPRSAFYGTEVNGNSGSGDPNAGYWVTFRGYTAGDTNRDHQVDGGDLSLIGGSWMQTYSPDQDRWYHADFNDDGIVDGGDLALMGGNWMWQLPAAPRQKSACPSQPHWGCSCWAERCWSAEEGRSRHHSKTARPDHRWVLCHEGMQGPR